MLEEEKHLRRLQNGHSMKRKLKAFREVRKQLKGKVSEKEREIIEKV